MGSLGRPVTRVGHHRMEAAVALAAEGVPGACPVGEDLVAVVPVLQWGWQPAERAARVACSVQLKSVGMQADHTAPVVAGLASQESG